MAILDAELEFSDAQVITANATTVASTNVIDQGALTDFKAAAMAQFGPENGKIWVVVTMSVLPTAGTSMYLDLEDCATAGGTYTPTGIGVDLANSIPIATLVAGYTLLAVPLPPRVKRFLRILYTTVGDHTGSAGAVDARLQAGHHSDGTIPYRA